MGDTMLGWIGIGTTVIFGVIAIAWGVKKINSRAQFQKQSVGKGGIGIQSGRDTKIGKS